jgi:putative cell wall-binding protein
VFDPGVDTVFVATGEDFPDALIAAPAAVALGSPLLLVRSDSLPAATAAEIQRLAPARIVVLGGTAAVNDATLDALRGLVPDTSRINAADRYALSAQVSQMYFPTTEVVYVAVGTTFADALTAGPASAVLPAPILLVRDTSLPAAVTSEMERLRPIRVVILGGPVAVSTGVEAQLSWLMG